METKEVKVNINGLKKGLDPIKKALKHIEKATFYCSGLEIPSDFKYYTQLVNLPSKIEPHIEWTKNSWKILNTRIEKYIISEEKNANAMQIVNGVTAGEIHSSSKSGNTKATVGKTSKTDSVSNTDTTKSGTGKATVKEKREVGNISNANANKVGNQKATVGETRKVGTISNANTKKSGTGKATVREIKEVGTISKTNIKKAGTGKATVKETKAAKAFSTGSGIKKENNQKATLKDDIKTENIAIKPNGSKGTTPVKLKSTKK